ncbi:unnamed protein product [Tenebrio molitor]|nr:unnamed protein product [Tenebrio molitor]
MIYRFYMKPVACDQNICTTFEITLYNTYLEDSKWDTNILTNSKPKTIFFL